jgi:5'-3' exonuclease
MGIQGYYAFLSAKYPQAIRELTLLTSADVAAGKTSPAEGGEYDHIYIDVNNFLYTSASGKNPSVEKVFVRLFTCIHSILRTFPPGRTVYLAMDGPGASFFLTNRTLFSLLLHLWQDC